MITPDLNFNPGVPCEKLSGAHALRYGALSDSKFYCNLSGTTDTFRLIVRRLFF